MNKEQTALTKAIFQDLCKTYTSLIGHYEIVEKEAESQLSGHFPQNGIVGMWIHDYFKKAGFIQ